MIFIKFSSGMKTHQTSKRTDELISQWRHTYVLERLRNFLMCMLLTVWKDLQTRTSSTLSQSSDVGIGILNKLRCFGSIAGYYKKKLFVVLDRLMLEKVHTMEPETIVLARRHGKPIVQSLTTSPARKALLKRTKRKRLKIKVSWVGYCVERITGQLSFMPILILMKQVPVIVGANIHLVPVT